MCVCLFFVPDGLRTAAAEEPLPRTLVSATEQYVLDAALSTTEIFLSVRTQYVSITEQLDVDTTLQYETRARGQTYGSQ